MVAWELKFVLFACCFFGSIYFVTPETETACENEPIDIDCAETEIVIESATYGSDPAFGACVGANLCLNVDNVLGDVSDSCDGEVSCTVIGNNTAFDVGDPCPNSAKYLSVTYRCKATCPDLGDDAYGDNTTLIGDATLEGGTREIACLAGFICDNCEENTITCQSSGIFSITSFSCRPDCGTPSPVDNAIVVGSLLDSPELMYVCEDGFVEDGDPMITCNDDGSFTTGTFQCVAEQLCPEPNHIENGIVLGEGVEVGDIRTLTCEAGFLCSYCDSNTIMCQADLKFSTSPFRCRPNCGTPPMVENAEVEGSLIDGPVLRYICEGNTIPLGNPLITCQSNGMFEVHDFSCVDNEFFLYFIISSAIAAILLFAGILQGPAEPAVVGLRPPIGLPFA